MGVCLPKYVIYITLLSPPNKFNDISNEIDQNVGEVGKYTCILK